MYKLIIENEGNEEIQVFGAMGPLPDASKKLLGLIFRIYSNYWNGWNGWIWD